jgi:hypothetical protein
MMINQLFVALALVHGSLLVMSSPSPMDDPTHQRTPRLRRKEFKKLLAEQQEEQLAARNNFFYPQMQDNQMWSGPNTDLPPLPPSDIYTMPEHQMTVAGYQPTLLQEQDYQPNVHQNYPQYNSGVDMGMNMNYYPGYTPNQQYQSSSYTDPNQQYQSSSYTDPNQQYQSSSYIDPNQQYHSSSYVDPSQQYYQNQHQYNYNDLGQSSSSHGGGQGSQDSRMETMNTFSNQPVFETPVTANTNALLKDDQVKIWARIPDQEKSVIKEIMLKRMPNLHRSVLNTQVSVVLTRLLAEMLKSRKEGAIQSAITVIYNRLGKVQPKTHSLDMIDDSEDDETRNWQHLSTAEKRLILYNLGLAFPVKRRFPPFESYAKVVMTPKRAKLLMSGNITDHTMAIGLIRDQRKQQKESSKKSIADITLEDLENDPEADLVLYVDNADEMPPGTIVWQLMNSRQRQKAVLLMKLSLRQAQPTIRIAAAKRFCKAYLDTLARREPQEMERVANDLMSGMSENLEEPAWMKGLPPGFCLKIADQVATIFGKSIEEVYSKFEEDGVTPDQIVAISQASSEIEVSRILQGNNATK